jgi:hypothetical protein
VPRFVNRVTSLEEKMRRIDSKGTLNEQDRRTVEHSLINLQIEMELFVRNLIFDCAGGLQVSGTGPVRSLIGAGFRSPEAAYHYLISLNQRKREPNWAVPSEAISAASKLSLSNLKHVSAELGITPWELDDLRYVRNFIAHRSKESALKLRSLGMVPAGRSIDPVIIALGPSPRGGKYYERWSGFARGVARRLAN